MDEISGAMAAVGLSDLFRWLMAGCGLSAILASILPPATRRSPRWWRVIRGMIDRAGANVWNARNARNRAL